MSQLTGPDPQPADRPPVPEQVSVLRAWLVAIDSLIFVVARRVAADDRLTPGQLPGTLRAGIAFGLASLAIAVGGSVLIGYSTWQHLVSETPSALDSAAFELGIINNTPFDLSLVALVVAAALLAAAVARQGLRPEGLVFLALPAAWVAVVALTRTYVASMIGAPVVVEVKTMLEQEESLDRGLAAAASILEIPGLRGETEIELRSAVFDALAASGRAMEALEMAGELASVAADEAPAVAAARRLPDLMLQAAKGQSSEFCRRMYERYCLPFDEAIRPSPFRFATSEDWSWMQRRWDREGAWGTEAGNALLKALASEFADDPDRPFVLYLLGEAAQLESEYPDTPPALLAAFTLARDERMAGRTSAAAEARFRRIAESHSDQTFVDDACLHYAEALTGRQLPTEALRYLCLGYGRGNADMTPTIEETMLLTGRLVSYADLTRLGRELVPDDADDTVCHVQARLLLQLIVTNAALGEQKPDDVLAAELNALVAAAQTVQASRGSPGSDHVGIYAAGKLAEAARSLGASIDSSGDEAPLDQLLDRLDGDLKSLWVLARPRSFGYPREVDAFAESRAAAGKHLAERALGEIREALDLEGGRLPVAVQEATARAEADPTALGVGWLRRADVALRRFLETANDFVDPILEEEIEVTISEVAKLAPSGDAAGDFFLARRIDELRSDIQRDWMVTAEEIEEIASRLRSSSLRRQLFEVVASEHLQLGREAGSNLAQQVYHLERAVRAYHRSRVAPTDSDWAELSDPVVRSWVSSMIDDPANLLELERLAVGFEAFGLPSGASAALDEVRPQAELEAMGEGAEGQPVPKGDSSSPLDPELPLLDPRQPLLDRLIPVDPPQGGRPATPRDPEDNGADGW